jgi:predicted transcriptional regulator
VVTSCHYGDAALAVYVKIAALGQRPEGCTAGVSYLSGLLGVSRSSVERSLTQLMRPAPDDDVVEVTSYRRTMPGGRGTTAVRRVRKPGRAELGAWVPTRAAEALSPRQLRAYAALSYAMATGHRLTLSEIGTVLRHRTGKRAGQPLDSRSVRRILRSLADLGWITVEQRAGYRGRHVYTVHDEPSQLTLTADLDEGSGADLEDGSLAIEEDPQIDSPDDERAGGSIRRRREQVVAGDAVENPPPLAVKSPYTGPELSLAPRIWRVLEPVHCLLAGLSPYIVRSLAREAGRQLDAGVEPERLRQRLEFRYASTDDIRDPGRWLLGAAIVRHGCGLIACESGRIWRTGERCQVCADLRAGGRPPARPPGQPRPPYPGPPYPGPPRATWCSCPECVPAGSSS